MDLDHLVGEGGYPDLDLDLDLDYQLPLTSSA